MAESDAEKTVLELLPKLLKEKPGFRYMVEDILSDRLVVKDEIKAILEENAREHQEMIHGITMLREDFNRAMEQIDRRFEENERAHQSFIKAMEENERAHQSFIKAMEENALEHRNMNQQIGAAGNEARDFYTYFYATKALEMFQAKHHVVPEVVKNEELESGHEIDVILSNGEVWVLETSRTVSEKDVERVVDKAAQVGRSPEYQGKSVHAIVAGLRLSPGVEAKARESGVEVLGLLPPRTSQSS